MPAIAIAGIGAAASLAGGAIGSGAAGNAAETAANGQIKAAQISADSQQKMYNTTRADQLPYLTAGAGAAGRLDYLLGLPGPQTSTQGAYKAGYGPQGTAYLPSSGSPVQGYGTAKPMSTINAMRDTAQGFPLDAKEPFGPAQKQNTLQQLSNARSDTQAPQGYAPTSGTVDPQFGSLMHDFSASDFQTDPGYAFRLSEGQKALDRSAAARGGLFSGATLKANDQYNQGFASNEYQNAYNRFQNNRNTKFNQLSLAAGGGQLAANNLSTVGAQYANNIGDALQTGYGNAANARASGYIGAADAWNGAIGGVGKAVNGYLQTRI